MNRVALVTGAGTGIGKAIAKALVGADFAVVLTGRRVELLEATAADIGGDNFVHAADVGIESQVDTLFSATVDRYGRLDLLVNNAGISTPAVPIEDLNVELWHQVVAVNLTGAFLCTRAAFRQMKAQTPQGGRIINNGSVSATTPRPHSAPYASTKHAITGLTKSSALDGRAFNIACGQIDLGNIASEMTTNMSVGVLQANGTYAPEPTIDAALVDKMVVDMARLPLDANVLTMTLMATGLPFVGRG